MLPLRFGHPEDKREAAAFYKRQVERSRIVENVVSYYTRYVKPEDWPTENAPHGFYPKTFNRVPLSILQGAARELQALKERRAYGV